MNEFEYESFNESPITITGAITENLSGIQNVQVQITNENGVSLASGQLALDEGIYIYSWDYSTYSNGTYTVIFTSTDNIGKSSQLILSFDIGFYTTPIEGQVFSDEVMYGLIALGIVMALFALFFLIKYTRKNPITE